ncbi:unnamed protein product [Plutella xylostella]|uniref:(diamondback moth) hypothetical protein n=1 Tax=Plutella xylostella TaxID=51655 RepID=A0A8S4G8E3_PLUXY|nr:unnamed protein product [Plutella xylostella]
MPLCLLYGCETWLVKNEVTSRLQVFVNKCLRRILGIYWPRTISNARLWEMTDQTPIDKEILLRKWRWIGHVLRRPDNHLSKQGLKWQAKGKRRPGRPRTTWRRSVEAEAASTGLGWDDLEDASQDREKWKSFLRALYATPILFSFRVKFYPPNPLLLKEDATRFQIYLQLKRDLLHGRLYCTSNEAAMLGALIIQVELGDYDPNIHVGNYVTEMKLLLRQTDVIEARIQEIHREPVEGTPGGTGGVRGMSAQEAERSFLKIACQLDTYGVDPHPVKDHRSNQLYLGINHSGILTFQGSRKTHHFKWNEVAKINFEGRMFIVHLNYPEKKHTVGFKCPSGAACRHVWCCAIEQMLFFTLPSASDACVYTGGGLFSWGTKFKYFGRTEREILERDGLLPPRDHPVRGRVE